MDSRYGPVTRSDATRWLAAARILLLVSVLWTTGCREAPVRSAGPSLEPVDGIVLISLDTLRADALSSYGNERPTTPFLDALATRSVLFERAVSSSPNTLTSHMTMLTGLQPPAHGVYPPDRTLSPDIPLVQELLQDAGFHTCGVAAGGYMKGAYGFARGFGKYLERGEGANERRVEKNFANGLKCLDRRSPGQPFFLFLHTYVPHAPYLPPAPYRGAFWDGDPPSGVRPATTDWLGTLDRRMAPLTSRVLDYYRSLYDGSVRYLDGVLAHLKEELDRRTRGERVALIVTSDHGEEFLEHGRLEHQQTFNETMHVPLIVSHPDAIPGSRVSALVGLVDVAATILDMAGLEPPRRTQGRSLTAALRGKPVDRHDWAFGEFQRGLRRTLYAQIDGRTYQLVRWDLPREAWVESRLVLDVPQRTSSLRIQGTDEPRRLRVRVDGRPWRSTTLGPSWTTLPLPADREGPARLVLTSDGCTLIDGGSCHGFRLHEASHMLSLFDLDADPEGIRDISRQRPELVRRMAGRLDESRWRRQARPGRLAVEAEHERRLRALGYLD